MLTKFCLGNLKGCVQTSLVRCSVRVFRIVTASNLVAGNERFGGHASSIFRKIVVKEMYPFHCCVSVEVLDARC